MTAWGTEGTTGSNNCSGFMVLAWSLISITSTGGAEGVVSATAVWPVEISPTNNKLL